MVVEYNKRRHAKTTFEVVRTVVSVLSLLIQLVVLGKVLGWFGF